jgi:predicted transposase/invertase (TIGR01784 family)
VPDHDHAYKLLFSHASIVRDLLEGFVRADWLAELDYDSLERAGGSYVSDDLRERSDDVVWRVRWGKEWLYIYLLIEFQSSVERFMAARILGYVALLYQDLIRSRRLARGALLPPVLPIVLYNGERRWSAPEAMESLLQPGPRALEGYRARIRYLLIDESRYRKSDLASQRNLAAALFRLENSRSPADVGEVVRSLLDWLKSPEQASLRRAFAVWLGRVILPKVGESRAVGVEDLQTMGTLLDANIREWAAEARREGRQEGRQQGRQEGEVTLLTRQLRRRFGELPEWVHQRLRHAPSDKLERWGERLLDVESLAALFESEEPLRPTKDGTQQDSEDDV